MLEKEEEVVGGVGVGVWVFGGEEGWREERHKLV